MPRANPLTATIQALISPEAFVRRSVRHDIESEFETNKELLKAHPDRVLPPDREKNIEDNARLRTTKIRTALFVAAFSTVLAVLAGVIAGSTLQDIYGRPSSMTLAVLQVLGAGIILTATLAVLGWEIQSYKGQSLPEKVNRWLFRAQYWLGTFLFVMSVAWA